MNEKEELKMKTGIIIFAALISIFLLTAGCAESAEAKGTLQVQVTDAPPEEVVTCIMVTVDSVKVHKAVTEQEEAQPTATTTIASTPESGENATSSATTTPTATPTAGNESGWITLTILDGKQTFDLLQVKGIEEVMSVTEMEEGKYTQIRMTISKVQVKLGDGDLQDATLPSGTLKFTHPFNIVAGQTTALLFDFDAEKSVNITGAGKIIVKPVIKITNATPKNVEAKGKNPGNNATSAPAGNEFKGKEANRAGLRITTVSLPNGIVDVSYSVDIKFAGGTGPFTWSVDSSELPEGLSLDTPTGIISGTPTASGESTFTVKVSDSITPAESDTHQMRIRIAKK